MKWKSIIVFWVFTILGSCSGSKVGEQQILDQDKMSNVMYDVLLAESYVESYLMKDTTLNKDSLLQVEMDKVLKVYGITDKIFSESYLYYKAHPTQLEVVMDSAHERAVRGRTDIFIKRAPQKKR